MRPRLLIFMSLLLIGSRCTKDSASKEVPVTFTCDKCDYIISGYKTDGIELNIKPGQVLCLDASKTYDKIVLSNLNGTPENPIIIRNCGGIAKLSTNDGSAISIEYSKNFKVLGDGTGEDNYGIRLTTKSSFFLAAGFFSTDFEIAQLEIVGRNPGGLGNDAGFAGMGIKTSPYQACNVFTDPTRQAWVMRNISIHDNYIHDVGGEGLYIGHGFYKGRKENECPSVTYSHSIAGLRVYNNLIVNTGFDGIQVKNADSNCEIYNNTIKNYGTRNEETQNEGLFLGEGVTGKLYNNLIHTGTGNGIRIQAMGNNDIFNNVVINAGRDGFNVTGSQYGVFLPSGYFRIFNNTIYNSKGAGFVFYLSEGGPKLFMNNLVVKAGGDLHPNGVTLQESNNLLTQDIGSIMFTNAGKADLRLNAGSPAINAGIDVRPYNPGLTFDFLNAERPKGAAFDIGAYEQQE